jgi:hypothetical protein
MANDAKILLTAEDRTRAAFASVERSFDTVAQLLLTEAMLRELLRERAPWFLGSVKGVV